MEGKKQRHRSPCYGYNGPVGWHWNDVYERGHGWKSLVSDLKEMTARSIRFFEVGDMPTVGSKFVLQPNTNNGKLVGKKKVKRSLRGPVASIKTDQSSCPHSCGLHPSKWMKDGEDWTEKEGAVNWTAMRAIDKACRKHEHVFGYTHRRGADAEKAYKLKSIVMNVSCDTRSEVFEYVGKGLDVVTIVPELKKKAWVDNGVRFVGCPAQTIEGVSCLGAKPCGGKKGPLCARKNRGYVVVFEDHSARSGSMVTMKDRLVQIGG